MNGADVWTVEKIGNIIHATATLSSPTRVIKYLLTDSRKVHATSDALFFCLTGERNNGHAYINDLYQRGVRSFVISDASIKFSAYPEGNFLFVKNSLDALQQLATYRRNLFHYPVIGITGSNGKTIVKELLYQWLREEENIVRSPKSYNSQVGVPLSVWQMQDEHSLAIFEAGISKPNEMARLETIIRPNIGVFTNVGSAHNENFESTEQKVSEKLRLFKDASLLIYGKDNEFLHQETCNLNCKLFTFSRKGKADLQITDINKNEGKSEINAIYKNSFIHIVVPFESDVYLENCIICWATMLAMGIPNEQIASNAKLLNTVAMRLELKEGVNNCSIINDSYNSDLASLSIALDFLLQQKQHEKRTLILSDILQSGMSAEYLYKEVQALITNKRVIRFIGIGEAISKQKKLFPSDSEFYPTTESFLRTVSQNDFSSETILLKGARSFSFERISKMLQQKAHETVMEINLSGVIHNLNYYKSLLKPETKIMAMVKAFSYGSGSFEIANVLQFNHVDYLAVAYADEGVELRKAGISLPIMVMNPDEQSLEQLINYQLEPEIYSMRMLKLFSNAIKKNMPALQQTVNIHLKLDTGMRRLGLEEKNLQDAILMIQNNKRLHVQSVFSHLAASDEKEHELFTQQQIEKFTQYSNSIEKELNYPILRHILNSGGIRNFPHAQFDMVRLGIGMYGISSNSDEQQKLQTVSSLKTIVSQIKEVKKGESIGYSRKAIATHDMRIATLPIGYADGYSRRLGNGVGMALIGNKEVFTVGNVCMDMCMMDISNIDAQEGDEVILFGESLPIQTIAERMGTIAYEVLTNVSRRVKRVYFQE